MIVILYAGKAASTPARRRKSAGAAQEKANPKSTLEKASFWERKEGFSESPDCLPHCTSDA